MYEEDLEEYCLTNCMCANTVDQYLALDLRQAQFNMGLVPPGFPIFEPALEPDASSESEPEEEPPDLRAGFSLNRSWSDWEVLGCATPNLRCSKPSLARKKLQAWKYLCHVVELRRTLDVKHAVRQRTFRRLPVTSQALHQMINRMSCKDYQGIVSLSCARDLSISRPPAAGQVLQHRAFGIFCT